MANGSILRLGIILEEEGRDFKYELILNPDAADPATDQGHVAPQEKRPLGKRARNTSGTVRSQDIVEIVLDDDEEESASSGNAANDCRRADTSEAEKPPKKKARPSYAGNDAESTPPQPNSGTNPGSSTRRRMVTSDPWPRDSASPPSAGPASVICLDTRPRDGSTVERGVNNAIAEVSTASNQENPLVTAVINRDSGAGKFRIILRLRMPEDVARDNLRS